MKNNNNKAERTLSLRTHSIRDLTAEDLRLAVGGRSGSGSGSGHAASGSASGSGSGSASNAHGAGSFGGQRGAGGLLSS